MFKIKAARWLAPDIRLFEIESPRIARKRQAGQFVMIRIHEHGERIPLTIADADPIRGTITLVVQGVGKTSKLLNMLGQDDVLQDVVGPLGRPSDIQHYGTTIVIGGGVGTAIALPTAGALKGAGNHVIGIVGARTRELVILEEEMRRVSDRLYLMTDDGSYGEHGLVTDKLQTLIDSGQPIHFVLAIGPIPMMRAVAELTRPHRIRTAASLNPIMVDGTGMCGGCRVLVGGTSRFACVDGPEFDAHDVDFTVLMQRNALYRPQEQAALERLERDAERDLGEVHRCRLQISHPEVGPRQPT